MTRFSRLRDELFKKNRHASEEELVGLLDGELPSRRADWVRRHLEVCWSCRAESAKTARVVSDLMEYRGRLVEALAGDRPQGRLRLESRRVLPSGDESVSRRIARRWAVSLASLTAGAAMFYLLLGPATKISVAEVLNRAQAAEQTSQPDRDGAWLYRKLAVRRWRNSNGQVRTATFEVWSDARHKQVRHTGSEQVWAEIDQVLTANRRQGSLLTVRGFNQWRRSVPRKRDELVRLELADGAGAWTVRTEVDGTVPENRILEGRLSLRDTDWMPVLESFRVQGRHGHRVYEIEALESRVTTSDAISSETKTGPPALPKDRVSASPVNTDEVAADRPEPGDILDEINAHYALHRLGICLDGALEVTRDQDRRLVLRGVTENHEQETLVAEALAGIPSVRMETQSVDAVAPVAVELSPRTASVMVEASPAPMIEHLVKYFALQPGDASPSVRAAKHADQVVTAARGLRRQGWALRRLADAFPTQVQPRTLPSAWLIEVMAADHVKGLRAELANLSGLIDPISGFLGLPRPPDRVSTSTHGIDSWSAAALRVFVHQERIQSLIQGLFAGAEPGSFALQDNARLHVQIQILAADLDALAIRLAEDFRNIQAGRVIP